MTPDQQVLQALLQTLTLFALLIGLVGLVVPIFPGLTVMWLGTLVYALLEYSAHLMTAGDWFLFALITILMLIGNVIDNIIITRKMRDQYVPWSSILIAFAVSLVASVFLTPLVGLVAAPVGLFAAEVTRLRDRGRALASTKAYMVGWGWAFVARFLIGLGMTGLWLLWALV
jgi:uncharacterized protein YqgC (DUF456 family)